MGKHTQNVTLTALNLAENGINMEGVNALHAALKENTSITSVDLSGASYSFKIAFRSI